KELIKKASKIIDQQVDNEFSHQQGLALIEDGQYELAIQELTKVLAADPSHIASIEAIDKARGQLVEQHEAINRLYEEGSQYIQEGKFQDALGVWQKILEIEPDNQKAQDYVHDTNNAITQREENIAAHLQKAETFLEVERYDKAVTEWEKILEIDPLRSEVKQKIEEAAAFLQASQAVPEKDKDLELVRETPPEVSTPESVTPPPPTEDQAELVRSFLDQGLQLYGAGDYRGAINIWRKVLDIDTSHEQALEYMELAKEELYALGEYDEDITEPVPTAETSVSPESMPLPQIEQTDIPEKPQDDEDIPDIVRDEPIPVEEEPIIVDTGYSPHGTTLEGTTEKINIQSIEDAMEDLPELRISEPEPTTEVREDADFDSYQETMAMAPIDESIPVPEEEITEPVPTEPDLPPVIEEPAPEPVPISPQKEKIPDTVKGEEAPPAIPPEQEVTVVKTVKQKEKPLKKMKEPVPSRTVEIEPLFDSGLAHYENGNFDKAITDWTEVLKINPQHKKTKILLDKAKKKLETKLDEIEEEVASTVKKKKTTMFIFGGIGIGLVIIIVVSYFLFVSYQASKNRTTALQYFSEKNYTQAITFFEQFLETDADDAPALEKLGISYLKVDQPQKAQEIFKKYLKQNKQTEPILVYLAEAYYKNGEYSKAKNEFEAAKKLNPNSIDAHLGLARSYQKLEETENAITEYQVVRDLEPTKITDNDWILIGQAYSSNGEFEKSIEVFLKVRQHSYQSEVGIGKGYFELNKPAEAIKWFNRAKKSQPKAADSRVYLGRCYYQLKKYEEAIAEYLEVIELFPDDIEVYLQLGTAYLKLNKHSDAISYYQKALQYHPNDPKLHYYLGFTHHVQGDYVNAIEQYQLAIAARQNYAEALANLGIVYLKNNDKDSAIKAWFASLKANPDQPKIQASLRRLGIN
ncbi:tetratricopeptide repeat protein, partial [candidate division CSSED10-310 bacterium]